MRKNRDRVPMMDADRGHRTDDAEVDTGQATIGNVVLLPTVRIPVLRAVLGNVAALARAACSEQPGKGSPTEQEIHASDSAVRSRAPGRHPYRCDDGRGLLVDYLNKGLTIELRRGADAAPIVLTAPMQGLQYIGDRESVTFRGSALIIEGVGQARTVCRKETTR